MRKSSQFVAVRDGNCYGILGGGGPIFGNDNDNDLVLNDSSRFCRMRCFSRGRLSEREIVQFTPKAVEVYQVLKSLERVDRS